MRVVIIVVISKESQEKGSGKGELLNVQGDFFQRQQSCFCREASVHIVVLAVFDVDMRHSFVLFIL
jgi:hypothetical protein